MISYYLDAFFSYLKYERGYAENTLCAYKRDLVFFQQDRPLNDLQDQLPLFYEQICSRSYSINTKRRKKYALKSFIRYLISHDLVTDQLLVNFFLPKQSKGIPSFLDKRSIFALFDAVDDASLWATRDYVIVELLYGAGLRVSELCHLRFSDVDRESGFCRVRGKGDRWRHVPLGRLALQAIESYLPFREDVLKGRSSSYLVLNKYARGVSRQWVFVFLKKLAVRAGLETSVSPHTLRHSYATHLLDGGAGIKDVQSLLGHADLSTTQVYLHVNHERVRSLYKKCHPRS